jgi:hypothetical protein
VGVGDGDCDAGAAVIAWVDNNSFYASVEQVFDPDSARRPVVVLSNNDTVIRLDQNWEQDFRGCSGRGLDDKQYVTVWAACPTRRSPCTSINVSSGLIIEGRSRCMAGLLPSVPLSLDSCEA